MSLRSKKIAILIVAIAVIGTGYYFYRYSPFFIFQAVISAHTPRAPGDFEVNDSQSNFPIARADLFSKTSTEFSAPELCDRISPHAYLNLQGGLRYLQENCKKGSGSYAVVLPHDLRLIMNQMGYDDAFIATTKAGEGTILRQAVAYLQKVMVQSDFKAKLQAMPSYNESLNASRFRRANATEYVYQLTSISNPTAQTVTCGRISPNAYDEYDKGRKMSLRDYCFFAVADASKNAQLCQNLPPQGAYFPFKDGMWDQQFCRNIITDATNMGGYSARIPHSSDIVQFLNKLGYNTNFTVDDDSYSAYIDDLTVWTKDPGARADFLSRVKRLPNAE